MMNWEFFNIVEEGITRGYKAKWAIYRAIDFGIPLTLEDIKELGEAYGHKRLWAYYTAKEFGIPPFKADTKAEYKKPDPEPKKSIYPENYFKGIFNKFDLKKAFRFWSKKLHPDLESGNQQEFIKMKKQYDNMSKRMD